VVAGIEIYMDREIPAVDSAATAGERALQLIHILTKVQYALHIIDLYICILHVVVFVIQWESNDADVLIYDSWYILLF